jgi:PST family polysaccharide transporter
VIQILVMEAVRGVGIFMLPGGRPTIHWKRLGGSPGASDLRSLWLSLVGLRAAAWLGDLPDLVLVGRMETTFVLGTYDTARRWARYFFEEPFLALTDVAIAGLRPLAQASGRFRELAGNAVLAMMTASLPALSFVAIEADALVRVVLGEQWLGTIPLLRVLALAAALAALSSVARWIYLATGRTRRLVRWSVFVRFPVMAVAAMVGTLGGAYGVAVAVAIASGVLVVPTVWYSVRETPVTTRDMLRWAARPAACSVGAAATLILANPLLDPTGASRLLKAGVLHGAAFAVLWHLAPGGLRDTRALIQTLRRA